MEASFLISCIMIVLIIILYMREYKRQCNSQYVYDLIKTICSINKTILIKKKEITTDSQIIISISLEFTIFNHLKKV